MAGNLLKNIVEGIAGAAMMATAFITPFLNSRRTRWGATDKEVNKTLPGDDLVPDSKGGYTHAITIWASTAKVWPWLVQLGQGRGGFYSYDSLENMVGCNIHSADRIIPEFQNLEVGDRILIYPGGQGYTVASIVPQRMLVLLERVDTQSGKPFELTKKMPDKYLNQSWVLFLERIDRSTTRLISRSRNDWNNSLVNTLVFGIFGPISLVMDRKMLLGIKKRAEKSVKRTKTATV
jgi:hypothetical protein